VVVVVVVVVIMRFFGHVVGSVCCWYGK
jgi:hypothetical protein